MDEHIKSVILQKAQFNERLAVGMKDLVGGKTSLDHVVMGWIDTYEFRLKTYFGEHVVVDKRESWPATWLDALKDRFMPKYFRRVFPIKYNTLEVKVSEVASKFVLPEKMGPIPIMLWEKKTFSDSGDDL